MTSTKLTKAQAGRLGGLRKAARHPDAAALDGAKGGRATRDTQGTEHFVRAAHMRHGRLQARR